MRRFTCKRKVQKTGINLVKSHIVVCEYTPFSQFLAMWLPYSHSNCAFEAEKEGLPHTMVQNFDDIRDEFALRLIGCENGDGIILNHQSWFLKNYNQSKF
jgi:hypothetical protein